MRGEWGGRRKEERRGTPRIRGGEDDDRHRGGREEPGDHERERRKGYWARLKDRGRKKKYLSPNEPGKTGRRCETPDPPSGEYTLVLYRGVNKIEPDAKEGKN